MALTPGSRLGRYEIGRQLGAGGMGEVYEARDSRLDRLVAIKVLPPAVVADPAALERFHREARAVAALSHPNVVAIHDFGEQDSIVYVVLEYLDGETMRAFLNRHGQDWRAGIEWVATAAETIDEVHARGFVHRDLKPENLFLTSRGVLKILDFGIASSVAVNEEATTGQVLTMTGTVLGTLGYMSPEQLRGHTPTATSDIFSLGCVLYEVLTGQRPFDRLTPADTMAAVLHDDPSFNDSGASWPPPLIAITRRCLAKEGVDRFQSGRDLAAALRTAVTAPATEQQADSIAVLPFANGGGADAEHLGDGLAESLINALARIPGLRVVPRSTVFRYKGHDLDPHALARELEVRLLLSGKVLQRDDRLLVQAELVDAVARQQLWGERFSRTSADIFSVEQEIASQIVEQLRVKLSREERQQISERATEDAQAYDLYLKARYHWSKRTPESIRHAIEYFEAAIERDPMFARAWAGLAETRTLLGWYGAGIIRELFDSAIAAARMAVKLNPELGEAHAALGFGLCCTGQWDNGLRECERAIQLSPGYFLAHDWYAIVLSSLGRFDEAAAAMATARRLEPLSLVVHHHDAWVSVMAGRFHDARQAASQALELDAGYSFGWWWLGITQTELGFTEDAVRSLERAAQIFGDFVLGHSALGHAYGRDGRREEALRCLTVLSRRDLKHTDPYHQALVHVGIGELEHALEELADAFAANSTWLRIYGPHDPRLNPLRGDRRLTQLLDAPSSTIRDIS